MQLSVYTRDESGLIEFEGVQDWESPQQLLAYFMRDDDPAEVETMLGWPDAEVIWHRNLGYAVRTTPIEQYTGE